VGLVPVVLERKERDVSRSIHLILPMPESCLWPNRVSHWTKKARAKKKQRQTAALLALPHRPKSRDPIASGVIEFRFYWPDARRRDMDNALAAMKSAIDGIKDAGVIADDSGFGFFVSREPKGAGTEPSVSVTIKESGK